MFWWSTCDAAAGANSRNCRLWLCFESDTSAQMSCTEYVTQVNSETIVLIFTLQPLNCEHTSIEDDTWKLWWLEVGMHRYQFITSRVYTIAHYSRITLIYYFFHRWHSSESCRRNTEVLSTEVGGWLLVAMVLKSPESFVDCGGVAGARSRWSPADSLSLSVRSTAITIHR